MNVNGKRILVTGGTSGVGLALTGALTAAGARVVTCGRRADRSGAGLGSFTADLAVAGEATRVVDLAAGFLGGLDVVVANAGVQHLIDLTRGPDLEVLALAEQELAVNLRSVVELAAASWPHLTGPAAGSAGTAGTAGSAGDPGRSGSARRGAARGGGPGRETAFVAVTSGLAYAPKKSAPVYCATKAAVHTLLRSLRYRAEDETPWLRVQEVVLPLVDTPMTAGREGAARKIPPAAAARAVVRGLERGRPVIAVGVSRTLLALLRVHPGTAYRILRNS
ncbi:SDR family NAD(P)-dependent oxidoreductase [Kitasatospora sp. NPDC058406]|uniref:SDR family NAD(P)-dependent oxidoreductase n=1 Tax=Kitasatospora sp. NPDC058406 TaxID=3346483 RepID=UPI0036464BBE